jgi:hypothetical protein
LEDEITTGDGGENHVRNRRGWYTALWPLSRRLAWVATGVVVAFGQVALIVAARAVDGLYAADPHWFSATYAEPGRTGAVSVVVLVTLAVAIGAAAAPRVSWKRFVWSAAAMLVASSICLELTRTVRFNDALGDLYVHLFVLRREKVALPDEPEDRCAAVDVRGPFVWRLGRMRIHPRLLPLPHDSARLIEGICRRSGVHRVAHGSSRPSGRYSGGASDARSK